MPLSGGSQGWGSLILGMQSVQDTVEGLLQPGHEKVSINGWQRKVGLGQKSLLFLGLAAGFCPFVPSFAQPFWLSCPF